MKRFIAVLAAGFIVILFVTKLMNSMLHEKALPDFDSPPGVGVDTALKAVLSQAAGHYRDRDFVAALQVLESHRSSIEGKGVVSPSLLFSYYQLKGYCHMALWQYVEAERSWRKAEPIARSNSEKQRVREMIELSVRAIDDANHERHLKKVYLASPGVGPAATLQGEVVLVYVFLADGNFRDWSVKDRSQVMMTWSSAERWLSEQARRYGVNVTFTRRLFVLNKHPIIKRLRVGDFNSNFANADKVAMLAARHFGADNVLGFINKVKLEASADQAILMFHLPRNGRSFASRCMQRCNPLGEFVFLMESPAPKAWQALSYTQVHESLHLFGADDLYNIDAAKYYAVRDIMNYPSSLLAASTLEGITAYATGLQRRRPMAPFKIKTFTTGR